MIGFAKVKAAQFEEICALYQSVISDMNQNGLRQWEWDVYPTRDQLEKDMKDGKLYRVDEDGHLVGAFVLALALYAASCVVSRRLYAKREL